MCDLPIGQNPARFGALTAERIRLFWFPDLGSSLIGLITVVGFGGAWVLFKRNRPAFWPLALYTPVYYLTEKFPRYRYPILWISFLLAAYARVEAKNRLFRARWKSPGRLNAT